MNQPLARLAFYLLEPRSDDGLVDWNFLDAALGPRREGVSDPSQSELTLVGEICGSRMARGIRIRAAGLTRPCRQRTRRSGQTLAASNSETVAKRLAGAGTSARRMAATHVLGELRLRRRADPPGRPPASGRAAPASSVRRYGACPVAIS